jgi:Pyruvate/2-oxoacid:ferredoxin oxidoreductase delta subunit
MAKVKRQIITIDEEKCDGCGNCVPACVEGALQVIDGKARLVKESYCDGLGACLGDCPQDALHVTTLEVEAYDEPAVLGYLQQTAPEAVERHVAHLQAHGIQSSYQPAAAMPLQMTANSRPTAAPFHACPSAQPRQWQEAQPAAAAAAAEPRLKSELRQWPVQLHLVPVQAPFYQGTALTLIADCVPFANPNMHADLLRDSAIAVGCPKLDDGQAYINKVTQILQSNDIRSLKVAYMEVPCCRGLVFIAQQALALSGKDIPFTTEIVSIQ